MGNIMNEKNKILNYIYTNGKLNHFALNVKWYQKNKLIDIYDTIFIITKFLDKYDEVLLRERIYYIENNLNKVVSCKYCNNKLKFKKCKIELTKTCGDWECRKQHQSNISKKMWANYDIVKLEERNNKISKAMTGRLISDATKEKIRLSNSGKKQSESTKKKRYKTRKNNGQLWHTLETIDKIRDSNIVTHNSIEFREKYKDVYEKSHKKISETMKNKILRGEFTPCITNSWTHWDAFVVLSDGNKMKFRSNWDAAFWVLNNTLKYEKVRIRYEVDLDWHSYIVDFVDVSNKKLYEIKPKTLKENKINKIKFESAKKWCKKNDYIFNIIDDDWFIQNAKKINYIDQPQLLKSMRQFL